MEMYLSKNVLKHSAAQLLRNVVSDIPDENKKQRYCRNSARLKTSFLENLFTYKGFQIKNLK